MKRCASNQIDRGSQEKNKVFVKICNKRALDEFEELLNNPSYKTEIKDQLSVICGKGKGRANNNAYALSDTRRRSHCSAGTHTYRDCPVKKDLTKSACYNCITHKKKYNINKPPPNHSATSNYCPRITQMLAKIRSRIDYGYQP